MRRAYLFQFSQLKLLQLPLKAEVGISDRSGSTNHSQTVSKVERGYRHQIGDGYCDTAADAGQTVIKNHEL